MWRARVQTSWFYNLQSPAPSSIKKPKRLKVKIRNLKHIINYDCCSRRRPMKRRDHAKLVKRRSPWQPYQDEERIIFNQCQKTIIRQILSLHLIWCKKTMHICIQWRTFCLASMFSFQCRVEMTSARVQEIKFVANNVSYHLSAIKNLLLAIW